MGWCRCPYELCAGLVLKTGIRVVLQLDSARERDRTGEPDLVLKKRAGQVVRASRWQIGLRVPGRRCITGPSVVESPDDVVTAAERDVLLTIEVHRMTVFVNAAIEAMEVV